jgi:hypothetical protein
MNADRRKLLSAILSDLEAIKSRIEEVKDDEQSAFDNMPESIQQGEKGQKVEAAVSSLEDAENEIDSAISSIETAGE